MRILMMTNTYLPHVGGVARSVDSFSQAYRDRGHETLVVAPTFGDMPATEEHVLRVPAIEQFKGTDFSWRLPVPGILTSELDRFRPAIVHSHHPFLLGDTALRIAAFRSIPIVFTWHTMYEKYIHYVTSDTEVPRRFMMQMAASYANLCDLVIAPSETIADVVRERDVTTAIVTIPTGIKLKEYAHGDGRAFRERLGLTSEDTILGHVGRLAPEKNLDFMARAAAAAITERSQAKVVVVGEGPSAASIREIFEHHDLADRLHLTGTLTGTDLADAYAAMDVFLFASLTETQGMVLAEALAAGVPVIALRAPGATEAVRDGRNGMLLDDHSESSMEQAIGRFLDLSSDDRAAMQEAARKTAAEFSLDRCADRALEAYERALAAPDLHDAPRAEQRFQAIRQLETEWNLWSTRVGAALTALVGRSS